jgi:hypothetical protein
MWFPTQNFKKSPKLRRYEIFLHKVCGVLRRDPRGRLVEAGRVVVYIYEARADDKRSFI